MAKRQGRLSSVARGGTAGGPYTALGSKRDADIAIGGAEIGSTTFDDGQWEDFLKGRKNAQITLTAAWDSTDAVLTQLRDDHFNDVERFVRWRFEDAVGAPEFTANSIVTQYDGSGPNDDLGTVSVTIRIKGAVTEAVQT